MPDVAITFRQLTQWPADRPRTAAPTRSPFDTSLAATYDELDRELRHLKAREIVLQLDLRNKADVRRDGRPYSDVRTWTSAVVLTFTKHFLVQGRAQSAPVTFACDQFPMWTDNLLAIARGMEALRRVDRYRISADGQQYRGYAALPGAGGTTPALNTAQAAYAIARLAGDESNAAAVQSSRDLAKSLVRRARSRVHPDVGGRNEDWTLLQEAERIIAAHYEGAL